MSRYFRKTFASRLTRSSSRSEFAELNFKQSPLRCMKHSELEMSTAGDYFCENGGATMVNSLLMCLHRLNYSFCNKDSTKRELSEIEQNSMFLTIFMIRLLLFSTIPTITDLPTTVPARKKLHRGLRLVQG
ncbi:hypothetical protein CRE_07576 [Caenorhabditis remanei]|uniref:Uncharacterized protein n=1 Tax=Caenorhabditis remanei TaxID=31234 RepID=E3MP27_CAERE|nr:hypothetical protein CRE_07576 [Caenorhabditis remanei]